MKFPTDRPDGILVLGRANIDMYVVNANEELEVAVEFEKSVGGAAANIAVGLSRLGRKVDILSVVSADSFGEYVKKFLKGKGVGTRHVAIDDSGSRTSLAFAERKGSCSEVIFYRNGASDLTLNIAQVDAIDFSRISLLVVTGTALSASPSREATFRAIERARWAGTPVAFDLDWRPSGWRSHSVASLVHRQVAANCQIILGTRAEFNMIMYDTDVRVPRAEDSEIAEHFLSRGCELLVFKRGLHGSIAHVRDSENWGDGVSRAGIYPVDVKKDYGAGDAYAAAMLHGLMEGLTPLDSMRWGAGAAAIVVSRPGCAASAPNMDELMKFISTTAEMV